MDTDVIINRVLSRISEANGESILIVPDDGREESIPVESLTKERLQGYFSADLPSDQRMPTSRVVTEDRQLTRLLNLALQDVFVEFGQSRQEISRISVVDTSEVKMVEQDNLISRAVILGTVLCAFFSVIIMILIILWDGSIYIPGELACRYGIPAMGAFGKGGKAFREKVLLENFKFLFGNSARTAVTAADADTDLAAVLSVLPKGSCFTVPCLEAQPEGADMLRGADKILLVVKAGAHNGKRTEALLEFMGIQECLPQGMVLWDADLALLRAYYFPGKNWSRSEE